MLPSVLSPALPSRKWEIQSTRLSQYCYSLHSAFRASGTYCGFDEPIFRCSVEEGAPRFHGPQRFTVDSYSVLRFGEEIVQQHWTVQQPCDLHQFPSNHWCCRAEVTVMHGLVVKVGINILFYVSFSLSFPPSGVIAFIRLDSCLSPIPIGRRVLSITNGFFSTKIVVCANFCHKTVQLQLRHYAEPPT